MGRSAGLAEIEVIASGDDGLSIDPSADDDRDGVPNGWETDFAAIIESDRAIVADRTMTWAGGRHYGSHAEGSVPSPGLAWYLAEGATHGAFDLFYLLQNPNDSEARVRVRYLADVGCAAREDVCRAAREPPHDLGG